MIIKKFNNFHKINEQNMDISPEDFVRKWNSEYKFIIYKNGKAVSGWEYLNDAIINGIGEEIFDIISDDMSEFEEIFESFLDEVNISLHDDPEDIDEDTLNDVVKSVVDYYKENDTILIKIIN